MTVKGCVNLIGLGFGLALGGGLVYALYISESARLIAMFLLGAFLLGGTVLATALLINRQWIRGVDHRTINNYRLQAPPTYPPVYPAAYPEAMPSRQEDLLPPLAGDWSTQTFNPDNDEAPIA